MPRACIALLAILVSACGITHTYIGVMAINDSDRALVVRDGRDRWLIGAGQSGHIFLGYAGGSDWGSVDYEILDAATCDALISQRVDIGVEGVKALRITAGLVASVEKANSLNVPDLAATEACPGPADGWSLWIVNPSERTYFIRARSGSATIVARVEPNSTRMAVGGFGETSTIELLDADCNVLSSLQRSGWGPFKGVIDEDSLRLEAGVSPVPTILSYGHVRVCGDA